MKMGPITIAFGAILILLGVGAYGYALANAGADDYVSPSPMIASGFGLILVIMGILANVEKLRMHVMHVAVLVGLIGFVVPAIMVIRAIMNNGFELFKGGTQAAMAAICGVFVALCVKSFIDARKARKQQEATAASTPE